MFQLPLKPPDTSTIVGQALCGLDRGLLANSIYPFPAFIFVTVLSDMSITLQ